MSEPRTCEWSAHGDAPVCGAPAVYRTRGNAMLQPHARNGLVPRWRYTCEACAVTLEDLGRIGLAVKIT